MVNACYNAGLRAYGTSASEPRGHDHDQYMPGYYCAGVYDFDMNMVEIVYGGTRSLAPPSKVPSSIASWQKDVARSTVSGASESRRAPLVPVVNGSRPPLLRSESEPIPRQSDNQGSHMLIGTLLGAAAGAIMTYAATNDKKQTDSRPPLSHAGVQRAAMYHMDESPPAYTQVQRSSTFGPATAASIAANIPLAIEAARELSAAASRYSQQKLIAPEPYPSWREAIEQSPSVASSSTSRCSKTLVSDGSKARAPSSHTSYSSKTITQDRYLTEKSRSMTSRARDIADRASKIAEGSTHSRAPRNSSRESSKRYPPVSYVVAPAPSSHRRSHSHAPSSGSHRTSFRIEELPAPAPLPAPSSSRSGRSEHSRKHSSSHRRSSSMHGSRMSSSHHSRKDEKAAEDDEVYPDDSISCVGTVVPEKRESRRSRRSEGKREGGLRRIGGSLFGRE